MLANDGHKKKAFRDLELIAACVYGVYDSIFVYISLDNPVYLYLYAHTVPSVQCLCAKVYSALLRCLVVKNQLVGSSANHLRFV